MKKLIILFSALAPIFGIGQTILMEEKVNADTIESNVGPNLKNFTYTYVHYGVIFGPTSVNVEQGRSNELTTGIRYKHKINKWNSWGFNFGYNIQTYRLTPPPTFGLLEYDKQKVSFNNLIFELYDRINLEKKRGNVIGKYIDIGAYGTYTFVNKYYLRINNKNNPAATSKYSELVERNLNYTNKFNYGFAVRLGWDWFAVYGKYRLSNAFNNKTTSPELPRFTVGLELGIVN